MNLDLIKALALHSIVLGLVLGVLGLIPFVGALAALVLFVGASVLVILSVQKRGLGGPDTLQQGITIGASIGFVTLAGFSATFFAIALLLNLFFNIENLLWISSIFSQGAFVPVLMVFFVGILCAMTNAFSAMALVWALDRLKK